MTSPSRAKSESLGLPKLSQPRQGRWLARERLFRQLDATRDSPLLWVSAPAGAGKTTLLASYAHARQLPAFWYQLDAGDADPASFFYHLRLLTKKVAPRKRKLPPLLTPEYLGGLPAFTLHFFRDLFARLPPSSLLVFDNYQDLAADSPLHGSLASAFAQAPEGVRLCVASRQDPPAAFARSRACGTLQLLQWDDIKLTPEEIAGIVSQRGKRLPPATVAEMGRHTEGWAAGVVLLLEGLRDDAPPSAIGTQRSDEDIFQYLADEVFGQSPPQLQDFLLRTSFLARFSSATAAELTENAQARQLLDDLVRRNYFTVRHDERVASYEYHPLLRSFLQQKANQLLDDATRAALCRRAGGLLLSDGRADLAVELLARAHDWQSLGAVIAEQAPALFEQGRWRTLSLWLDRLPAEIIAQNPLLQFWQGLSLLPFAPAAARAVLGPAYEQFKQADQIEGQIRCWSAIVDSFVFEWDDFTGLDRWIDEMEPLVDGRDPPLPAELEAEVIRGLFLALMNRRPQHPRMQHWAERAWTLGLHADDPALRIKVGPHLLLYHAWWTADLAKAELLLNGLKPLAESSSASPLVQTTWCAMAGAFYWMSAANARSIEVAERGLEIGARDGVHGWDVLLLSHAVFASLSAGQRELAASYIERLAAGLAEGGSKDHRAIYYYLSGWYEHLQGRHETARESAKIAIDLAKEAGSVFQTAIFGTDYGRTLFYCGEHAAAERVVAEALTLGQQMQAHAVEYLGWLARAEFALLRDDRPSCVDALRCCLAIGRRRGFQNHTWWDPAIMSRLYALALESGIETEYVRATIRMRGLLPDRPPVGADAWPWPLRIHTLGRFSVLLNDRQLTFKGKAQRRPLDLLKALVALGGRKVSIVTLSELLWPDAEGDAAINSLGVTLRRLRTLLEDERTLVLEDGALSLAPQRCWLDTWAFEHRASELERAIAIASSSQQLLAELSRAALDLYQGEFLVHERSEPWVLPARERLRSRHRRLMTRLAERLMADGARGPAIEALDRLLDVDPHAEAAWRQLMRLYDAEGDRATALSLYDRMRTLLRQTWGIEPATRTSALAATIASKKTGER